MNNAIWAIGTIVLCIGGVLWLCQYSLELNKPSQKRTLAAILSFLAIIALWHYVRFGVFHSSALKQKNQNFHIAEMYHYYLGSKYFKETGYFDLYGFSAVAIQELKALDPSLPVNLYDIRDLRNKGTHIPAAEVIGRYESRYRNAFTEERKNAFKKDLLLLVQISPYDDVWRLNLFDAGYNSSPVFACLAGTVANWLPLENTYAYLGYLDIFLILLAGFLIYKAFGLYPALAFSIVFGTNPLSTYEWIGGSFLRQLWLFSLIAGLCCLKKERYSLAGLFLGYSAIERIFPIFFVAGACLPMLYQSWVQKKPSQGTAAFLSALILTWFSLSILATLSFGFSIWHEFALNLKSHSRIFFVPHVGLQRVIVYYPGIGGRNFWWTEGLARFTEWGDHLHFLLKQRSFAYSMVSAPMILSSCYIARRQAPQTAALFMGSVLLYTLAVPAAYYYSFLALFPVILFQAPRTTPNTWLLASFWVLMITLRILPMFSTDDIIYFTLYSLALGIFYLVTIGLMLWAAIHRNKSQPYA